MDQVLLWYERVSRQTRLGVQAGAALLVLALGWVAVIGPKWEAAREAAAQADQAEERLAEARRDLARYDQPVGNLQERWEQVRRTLRPGDEALTSPPELLTALTRAAEEAGAESPIFNPVSEGPTSPSAPWLRVIVVEGQLFGRTRMLVDFLNGLRELPVVLLVDSLGIAREGTRARTSLRIHALYPAGGEAARSPLPAGGEGSAGSAGGGAGNAGTGGGAP